MRKILAIVLAAMMVLSLAACGSSGDTEEKIIKIGIAAPEATTDFLAGAAYSADKFCRDSELEYLFTTASDAEEMTANLHDLVEWGATIIVTWPQWGGVEDAVQEIIDSGVIVVSFDADIACEGIYKVTGDNYDLGYRCAEHITQTVGEIANIVVLDVPSESACAQRKVGFYDYMDEVGYDTSNILEFQLDSFSREEGRAAMAQILDNVPQVDAVFSMDDETSIGCIEAIRAVGRSDVKAITGGGGRQEYFRMIADEQYADLGLATMLYSPTMVNTAIRNGINVLNEKDVEPVQVIPATVVTEENVADYLDEDNTAY